MPYPLPDTPHRQRETEREGGTNGKWWLEGGTRKGKEKERKRMDRKC